MNISKDEFLMIASHFWHQARDDEEYEKDRWRAVFDIINKYVDHTALHDFEDNRERLFVKILKDKRNAWKGLKNI
jgi:predicted glycosyltransferase involved in capsule biosynthesis